MSPPEGKDIIDAAMQKWARGRANLQHGQEVGSWTLVVPAAALLQLAAAALGANPRCGKKHSSDQGEVGQSSLPATASFRLGHRTNPFRHRPALGCRSKADGVLRLFRRIGPLELILPIGEAISYPAQKPVVST